MPFKFIRYLSKHQSPDGRCLVLLEEFHQFLDGDKDTCDVRFSVGFVHMMPFKCLPIRDPMFVDSWNGFSKMHILEAADKLRFIYQGGMSFEIVPYRGDGVQFHLFLLHVSNRTANTPGACVASTSREHLPPTFGPVQLLGNFQIELGWSKDCPEFKYLQPLCCITCFVSRT